jgi:Holliday junction resolvase
MATPEKKVKDKVKKVLDLLNCYYFFPATGGFGKSGVPDIVACIEGRFVGIECKANGNKPTPLQEKNLKDIGFNGGIALVIDETNVSELKEWLEGELAS